MQSFNRQKIIDLVSESETELRLFASVIDAIAEDDFERVSDLMNQFEQVWMASRGWDYHTAYLFRGLVFECAADLSATVRDIRKGGV